MNDFLYLIPVALALGALGLGAFMSALRSGHMKISPAPPSASCLTMLILPHDEPDTIAVYRKTPALT